MQDILRNLTYIASFLIHLLISLTSIILLIFSRHCHLFDFKIVYMWFILIVEVKGVDITITIWWDSKGWTCGNLREAFQTKKRGNLRNGPKWRLGLFWTWNFFEAEWSPGNSLKQVEYENYMVSPVKIKIIYSVMVPIPCTLSNCP